MRRLSPLASHTDLQSADGLSVGIALALGDALAYLSGEDIDPPKVDWNIGHYLTLAGTVKGTARSFSTDTGRTLVIVRDSYPTFGWDGYHLQPAEAIANALRRDDGAEGGVLLFVAAKNQLEIEGETRARGFDIAVLGQRHTLAVGDLLQIGESITQRARYTIPGRDLLQIGASASSAYT
jgi:hypothetical protein